MVGIREVLELIINHSNTQITKYVNTQVFRLNIAYNVFLVSALKSFKEAIQMTNEYSGQSKKFPG